jgi:hypothetical protein
VEGGEVGGHAERDFEFVGVWMEDLKVTRLVEYLGNLC